MGLLLKAYLFATLVFCFMLLILLYGPGLIAYTAFMLAVVI